MAIAQEIFVKIYALYYIPIIFILKLLMVLFNACLNESVRITSLNVYISTKRNGVENIIVSLRSLNLKLPCVEFKCLYTTVFGSVYHYI